MPEPIFVPADDGNWMFCYTMAIERHEDLCMAVLRCLADHEPLADLVELVAGSIKGGDDPEAIALYERAKAAAVQDDREGGIRR